MVPAHRTTCDNSAHRRTAAPRPPPAVGKCVVHTGARPPQIPGTQILDPRRGLGGAPPDRLCIRRAEHSGDERTTRSRFLNSVSCRTKALVMPAERSWIDAGKGRQPTKVAGLQIHKVLSIASPVIWHDIGENTPSLYRRSSPGCRPWPNRCRVCASTVAAGAVHPGAVLRRRREMPDRGARDKRMPRFHAAWIVSAQATGA
jgi:hypothetical protein